MVRMEIAADTAALVFEAQQGSRTAFATLVRRYQAAVRNLVARYLRDTSSGDDVAQEVFLIAFQQLSNLRDADSFEVWLFGIARNQVKMHLRSEGRRQERMRRMLDAALSRWQHEQLEQVYHDAQQQTESLAALRSCLDELPAESRAVVERFYFEQQSAESIAASSDRSAGAVRMMLLRIRQGLASCVRTKTHALGDQL